MGVAPPKDSAEQRAALLHELMEALTATGNYLAAANRISESETRLGQQTLVQALEKGLAQCERAGEVARRLRAPPAGDWSMRTITRVRAVDFAQRMTAMRIWLDEHRFEPSRFKYSEDRNDVLIDVEFKVAAEAAAFSARFNGGGTGACLRPAGRPIFRLRSGPRPVSSETTSLTPAGRAGRASAGSR